MSGRVVHFEIPFDDAERARSFYAEAFDWQMDVMPEMDYTMVQTGPVGEDGWPTDVGYIGGGMMQRQNPTEHPVITLGVDDLDASLAKIESLGGTIVVGKQQVGDMGWSAYFEDVEGNLMGLFQANEG